MQIIQNTDNNIYLYNYKMIAEQTKLRENERVRTKINLRNNWAFEQKTKTHTENNQIKLVKNFYFRIDRVN